MRDQQALRSDQSPRKSLRLRTRRSLAVAVVISAVSGLAVVVPTPPVAAATEVGDITTVGGIRWGYSGNGGGPRSPQLNYPFSIARSAQGDTYFADVESHVVRKVSASGVTSTVAGDGAGYDSFGDSWAPPGYSGDGGPATEAKLRDPFGVALDSHGNLYIADNGNNAIRRVDADTGVITTVAGTGAYGYSGNGGPATQAALRSPVSVAIDGDDNVYFSEFNNHVVRKVDASTGVIGVVAGSGVSGFAGDGGPATAAELASPEGIALDGAGNLHIADYDNSVIRRVDASSGVITTVAGTPQSTGLAAGDGGPATEAILFRPFWVAFDEADQLYVSSHLGNTVRRVDSAGIITTIVGTGARGYSGDGGPATQATLKNPLGILVDGPWLYVADSYNDVIRRVELSTGTITSWAGRSGWSAEGLSAGVAAFNYPHSVVADAAGNAYVADTYDNTVRRISATTGIITTVAGNGITDGRTRAGTFSGDGGPATEAGLHFPTALALDHQGHLYIADRANYRIRRVDLATGVISTVAGSGDRGYAGDGGPATAAMLDDVEGLAVDADGTVFIADNGNNRVRMVDPAGTITTFAGTGAWGYSGDGGAATAAALSGPAGLAVDADGNVAIADNFNDVVRGVRRSDGTIATIAGTGTAGYSGDGGAATAARLSGPAAVAFDDGGNLYVTETANSTVREVDAVTGVIATVAGNGTAGYTGDEGPAAEAQLNDPLGVAADPGGNLFVVDSANNAVRYVLRHAWVRVAASTLFGFRRSSGYVADPVNTATGNFTTATVDVDFIVDGLDWSRTYNSRNPDAGALGPGWSAGFDATAVELPGGDVAVTDWDGRRVTFVRQGSTYVRPEEFFADLTKKPDGTLALVYDDGREEYFDQAGRLVGRRSWDGQEVTLAYADGRPVSASHNAGVSLTFAYTGPRLTGLVASDGRQVSFGYTNGKLTSVTDAAGGVTTYGYDAGDRLDRITDADGVVVVQSTYDALGRVVAQTTPSGDAIAFSYDDATGITTVASAATGSVSRYAHDHQGRLRSITDAHGQALTKSYDSAGNLVALTDRRGAALTQSFDDRGNVLTRSSPEGVSESFTYDASGRLSSVTDGQSSTTTFAYEGAERLPSTVVDAGGQATTYAVGADGLVTSITDADGVAVSFGYDDRRNLTTITDAAGQVATFGYDAAGNLTSQTTPLGLRTTFTSDPMRRPLTTTDPSGATVAMSWTPAGRPASTTDAEANTTAFDHDAAGRLQKVTDALGGETTYAYDVDANLTSITRPAGPGQSPATWQASYDALGRRVSETDPTGVTTTYGFDADGNPTTTTDEDGGTLTRTFDLRGRLTSVVDPLGHQRSFTWDQADRLASVTDPTGATTAYAYDAVGRLVAVTDAADAVWSRGYTPAGRPATEVDPLGHVSAHAYDALGRLASTTDPRGAVTIFGYDHDGRLASQTSPEGLVTTYARDHAQRTVAVTSPAGGATVWTYTARGQLAVLDPPATAPSSFAYDALGRLERSTDALGQATTFSYDVRGNRVGRTDAKGAVETYTYDAADRPTGRTDALGRTTTVAYDNLGRLSTVADPSGRAVTIGYDAASRVASRTWAAGAFGDAVGVTYAYDAAGRRTSMTGPDGTTTWAYDPLGRLSATSAGARTVASGYDAAGRRTSLTYPDATTATSTFDAAGRLATLSHPSAGTIAYAWDDDGRLLGEDLPGPDGRSWSYDAAGRLDTYAETLAGESRTTNLSHDLADRITAEVTGEAPATYGYDAAGQLTTVTRGTGLAKEATTYAYDALGNRTSKATAEGTITYDYDSANQLTNATRAGLLPRAVTFTHDGAGRLSTATTTVGGLVSSRSLSYDAKGHLAEVKAARPGLLGGSLVDTTRRSTDADGRLIGLSRTDSDGQTSQRALSWDLAPGVARIATSFDGASATSFLSGPAGMATALRGGQGDAFAADVHGSTLATGEAADLAQAGSYDEFGAPVTSATDFLDEVLGAAAGSVEEPASFGYRGELSADGLVHLRAREYAPSLGRFTTQDPLDGQPGQVTVADPYPYASNDPLNQIDPLGLSPVSDAELRLSAAVRTQEARQWLATALQRQVLAYSEREQASRLERMRSTERLIEWQEAARNARRSTSIWSNLSVGDAVEGLRAFGYGFRAGDCSTLSSSTMFSCALGEATLVIEAELASFGLAARMARPATAQAPQAIGPADVAVIGKVDDLGAATLRPGERSLLNQLPNQGSPRLNYLQNDRVLRTEMGRGVPIRDVSVDPVTGALRNNTGFLRAERNILTNHDWAFDPKSGYWYPPGW